MNAFDPVTAIISARQVRKRDGATIQPFDFAKIETAVRKAWETTGTPDESKLRSIVLYVANSLPESDIGIEQIQDTVEIALMKFDLYSVAKHYVLYRQKRAELREERKEPDPSAVSNYIHFSKYARYLPDELRREVYAETVQRVEDMHTRRFPELAPDIKWAFDRVREKKVLPSMRSMQFAGASIETNNNRLFNCTATLIDRVEAFSQALFLLLAGCGVGYSVQYEHVDKLPQLAFIDTKHVVHHVVGDTIEGWADALSVLIQSYVEGFHVEFSYHAIRPAGAALKTSGGRAPGHIRLKSSLEAARGVLHGAQGRKLRPIECHRILCHSADAALSGGIRRSAMIALFSLEDSEMMYCKTGNWFEREPWFANANNSVMLLRHEIKEKKFKRIFQMTREWGEPGFLFCDDLDYVTNPCCEIGLNPLLVIDEDVLASIKDKDPTAKIGDVRTGWAFCNLCELNASKFKSLEDMLEAAKAATIIGTIQASYTDMPYLGWVSEEIAKREALLGIGMTGMLDAPEVALNPSYQRSVAQAIQRWNVEYASRIGIRPAARTTTVKPSGTTSLELGCVGSGHHAHHARRYIRRVIADELEVIFQKFREINSHMCARKPDGKWVIEFPVQAPDGAVLKEHLNAIQFLEMVRSTYKNWVLPGTARPGSSPNLTHNVSNTVHVLPEEWNSVADYLWKNRSDFAGVSLIAATSDKTYAFAPNEAVVTEADEARWNHLIAHYQPIDYASLMESVDGTMLVGELACSAGGCE